MDAGSNGACSDAQIWNDFDLNDMIVDKQLDIPTAEPLVKDELPIPYMLIGDDAFAIARFLDKSHSKRNLTRQERISPL